MESFAKENCLSEIQIKLSKNNIFFRVEESVQQLELTSGKIRKIYRKFKRKTTKKMSMIN